MHPKSDLEAQNGTAPTYEAETKLGSSRDRMWSLYMKQAGAFDRNMIEDWKGVMEGTLIFAGLFSAVVTAFMVESLRGLAQGRTPDTSVYLDSVPFISYSAYLAISTLWSLSLAFSMGCAISATLVQQWARSYLHAVDNQHHPPHKRALIRAYMYEGMQHSHMTFAIEGIPILLHMSLFLFLIGLIVYFYNIDPLISYPIMAVFILATTMYLIPTCMPLVRSNFPFHTPLSSPYWWAWRVVWHREPLRSAKTMETIREYDATHNNRIPRGYEAISWILSQSDEDREFEQFLDAIAGYKGGSDPRGGRVQIADLVGNYPSETLLRTYTMLRSCGRFSKKLDNRTTVILRAIPALVISWSMARGKWETDHGHYLSLWPLQMLKVLDEEAVAGNKAALDSDLVISTYHILLRIALQALIAPGDQREIVATGHDVETKHIQHVTVDIEANEDLNIDHEIDNIRAARELILKKHTQQKLANARPFDVITDVLVSGTFRYALSRALEDPSQCATILAPYDIMLHSFSEERDPQQRFSACARELFQISSFLRVLPGLRDEILHTSALVEDVEAITIILPTVEEYLKDNPDDIFAHKTRKTLDEKLRALRVKSFSPATTRPPSHKEGKIQETHADLLPSPAIPLFLGRKYDLDDVGVQGLVTGGSHLSDTTLTGNESEYFPLQESDLLAKSSPDTMTTDLNRDSFGCESTRTAHTFTLPTTPTRFSLDSGHWVS